MKINKIKFKYIIRGVMTMSIWTHVNCNFRLADYQVVSDKDIYKVFGKQLLWGEEFNGEEYYLPMGSEESLHFKILNSHVCN